jgi:thioredoxin:protein disulfide reductase
MRSLMIRAVLYLMLLPVLGTSLVNAEQSGIADSAPAVALPNDGEFLSPDQAFALSTRPTRDGDVAITWKIADGYYLYRKRMGFSVETAGLQLGEAQFPKGQTKTDEYFGKMEVYHDAVTAVLPVSRPAGAAIKLALQVKYQGCAEAGLCYNPITKVLDIELPAVGAARGPGGRAAGPESSGAMVSEQDRLADLIRSGSVLGVLSSFFGIGLLLAFTPCVLPMIPILSGIIVGQREKVTPVRGFSLAFSYVQGMALTYAAAAVAFVLIFKQAPQAFFQKPWIIASFAALFAILALAMFGGYTLQLPNALQTRLAAASNQQRGGSYVGTFIMGALSALIVTACVAPALIAALSVISQTGQIARGGAALYFMGLGMGTPLLLVGASAGSLLPKAGAWMDTVKSLFGVMFLGIAIYLLSSLLSGAIVMTLWATLAIVTGFWLFALQLRADKAAPTVLRGIGLVTLIYGVLLMIGAASGGADPLQPLQGLAQRNAGDAVRGLTSDLPTLAFERIRSTEDLDARLTAARTSGKAVMLDFYADWCASCKEMEKYTFTQAAVREALSNVVLLQADVTANDEADQALLKRFGIFGPPTIAFFIGDSERRDYRVVGYMPASKFSTHASAAIGAT